VPSAVRDLVPSTPTEPRNPLRRAATGGRYPEHTRARDVDRDTTCQVLDNARSDGQLTEEEYQTLTELAGGAKTLGEPSTSPPSICASSPDCSRVRPSRSRCPTAR
jgi:hypothetical protein